MLSQRLRFRAWNKIKKEMVNDLGSRKAADQTGNYHIDSFLNSDFEIMQSTGLEDRNGKEIFEGDVLRILNSAYEEGKNRAVVEWNEKSTGFDPFIDHQQLPISPVSGCGDYPENCEVIGNIYENPELLEEI